MFTLHCRILRASGIKAIPVTISFTLIAIGIEHISSSVVTVMELVNPKQADVLQKFLKIDFYPQCDLSLMKSMNKIM